MTIVVTVILSILVGPKQSQRRSSFPVTLSSRVSALRHVFREERTIFTCVCQINQVVD